MDIENLLKAIVKAGQSLADAWLFKMGVALVISTATSLHGSALITFVTLVFIDLLTRWIALCYTHLKDCGLENDLVSCILDIPAAFKAGYINSNAMKHRFVGKIVVYIVLTFMAVKTDELLQLSGEAALILKVTWVYLATTEAISVLENLRDAGVEQASGLLDFFRSKLTVWLDRFKQR
ncbi:phage holin family protein [Pelosinus propionicus]|uniref:Bacteriophage holin family protein n=1 Tax=Pelosinus propionicus DSM 13327 TaxID=1123291 RepID=A0A1I4P0Y1_9FIRM|nr:phage holin family protein [Pelosinus propionicus]SFM21494.1 Bacteriophage holin family protein [Pelosinus propionicus DSM 13327]